MNEIDKVVVIPSDPLSAYERNGYGGWLERYYNPAKVFKEVFIVSPLENGNYNKYGANIIGVSNNQFSSIIKELRPNVIRAYGGFWASDLAISNRISDIPIVVSLHDTSLDLMHISIINADMVLCTTKAVADNAIYRGVFPEKIRILPNRVDLNIFKPIRDTSHIAKNFPDGKYILHIGRKSPEKNLEVVISALRFLPNEYKAVFIGNGDTNFYIKIAEQYNVSDRCFWIKSIKNEELPAWYSWCSCMCTPSLREGFGIVFIEALACGARVVTSNIAPLNEYMIHEKNAYLVDNYKDGKSIAEYILLSTIDNEKNREISRNAIASVDKFSVEKIDELEKSFYLEVIGGIK